MKVEEAPPTSQISVAMRCASPRLSRHPGENSATDEPPLWANHTGRSTGNSTDRSAIRITRKVRLFQVVLPHKVSSSGVLVGGLPDRVVALQPRAEGPPPPTVANETLQQGEGQVVGERALDPIAPRGCRE